MPEKNQINMPLAMYYTDMLITWRGVVTKRRLWIVKNSKVKSTKHLADYMAAYANEFMQDIINKSALNLKVHTKDLDLEDILEELVNVLSKAFDTYEAITVLLKQ